MWLLLAWSCRFRAHRFHRYPLLWPRRSFVRAQGRCSPQGFPASVAQVRSSQHSSCDRVVFTGSASTKEVGSRQEARPLSLSTTPPAGQFSGWAAQQLSLSGSVGPFDTGVHSGLVDWPRGARSQNWRSPRGAIRAARRPGAEPAEGRCTSQCPALRQRRPGSR